MNQFDEDSILAGPTVDFTLQTTPSALDGGAASATPFWGDAPDGWDTVFIQGVRLPGLCKLSGKGFEQRVDKKKSPGKHGAQLTRVGNEPAEVEISVRMWTAAHLATFESLVRNHLKPKKAVVQTRKRLQATGADNSDLITGNPDYASPNSTDADIPPGFGGSGFAEFGRKLRDRPKIKTVTTTRTLKAAIGGAVNVYHPALAIFGIRSLMVLSVTFPERVGPGEYEAKLKCIEFVAPAQSKSAVTTAKASAGKVISLGPGAVGRVVKAKTPADDNTGP